MLKRAWTFFWLFVFIRDREGIRTPNPQSRNLIFYPVELRSRFLFRIQDSWIWDLIKKLIPNS